MSVLSDYAIIDLDTLKAALSLSEECCSCADTDTQLEKAINTATEIVENVLGFKVVTRTSRKWYDLDGSGLLRIPSPVQSIGMVAVGMRDAFFIRTTNTAITTAQLSVTDTGIVIVTVTGGTVTTSPAIAFATYDSISEIVARINSTISGVAAETLRDDYAYLLRPCGGVAFLSGQAIAMADTSSCAGFALNADTGQVTVRSTAYQWPDDCDDQRWLGGHDRNRTGVVSNYGRQMAYVQHTHGFAEDEIPADIEQACVDVATSIWLQRGTDPSLRSERLGSYGYERGENEGGSGAARGIAVRALAGRARIR